MIDHKNFKCPLCGGKLKYTQITRGLYCGKCRIQGTAILFETIIELKEKDNK
jgi:transcription initiation factor IIE alpha subunit